MPLLRRAALVGLILLIGPAAVLAQTRGDPGCDFADDALIESQTWSAIQQRMRLLVDTLAVFDKHPLVSDRQSLVRRGSAKQARSMALVAGRRRLDTIPESVLEDGCFVGMVESEQAEPDVGAFKGKTLVWVDRKGPERTWRSLQFPLDGEASLGEAAQIEMPYAEPASFRDGVGTFAPADAHRVFSGTLYRGELDSLRTFMGARWIIQPPSTLTPTGGEPSFESEATDRSFKADMEVMACYRCDSTTCCPQWLKLILFLLSGR